MLSQAHSMGEGGALTSVLLVQRYPAFCFLLTYTHVCRHIQFWRDYALGKPVDVKATLVSESAHRFAAYFIHTYR